MLGLFYSKYIYIENQKTGNPEKIPWRSIKTPSRASLKRDKTYEGTSQSGGGKIITSEPEKNSFTLQALTAVLSFHCTLGITHVQLTDPFEKSDLYHGRPDEGLSPSFLQQF